MAGTVTLTTTNVGQGTSAYECSIAWTCDASGNVSGDAINLPAGTILTVEFVPGTGAAQPTNLYSVDLKDTGGTSMFDDGAGGNIGASLSNVNVQHKVPFINGATTTYVRSWLQGSAGGNPYQLTVSAAGVSKSGTVNIYVSPVAI